MGFLSVVAAAQTVLGERLEADVLPGLEACLEELTASSDDWLALLNQVYAPQEAGFLEQFGERVEQLRQGLLDGSFTLKLELRSGEELQGNLAAYAAGEAGFTERILINADWVATASTADLERVLLEELGHAFDQRLNLGADTQGDEGQLFAARVLGDPLDSVRFSAISEENDGGVLQLNGQAVSVEFAANPSYNAATYDTDGDGVIDESDLDDDNDGILDTVEAKTAGVDWKPNRQDFSYAQNTAGGNTTHDAAGSFLTGDRDDPFNFFDGDDTTELRVHALDVYEFKLPFTGVKAGSSFTLREGKPATDYDGITMVLASLGTTDPSGDQNNSTGGGVGWKTISRAFGNVATPSALGARFTGTPIVSTDQKFVLLYYGASDQDLTLTTPIDVDYLQIVGIQTHGGWGDISVASQVDLTLDTDQDGIPNSRDLDSDNDGISDLYESVGSSPSATVVLADTDRSGTISQGEAIAFLTASGGWLDPSSNDPDYNKNGLWDFLDSSGATSANTPVDSDGDSVADLLDLDSDNDGIPDTVEARPSANYKGNDAALDPSGVRNNDADGDGVINLFDSNDASGSTFGGTFGTPVNTDASGEGSIPIFQETGKPINATVDLSVDGITIGDINSILTQDASVAEINKGSGASPDMLVLDMGKDLTVGSKVLIRAQVSDINGTLKLAQTDSAGSNPLNDTEFSFTAKNAYQLFEYTVTTASTRYIRFMTNSRDRRVRIDTVSWGMGVQGVGQASPDYIDSDSDEDTFLDQFESGLLLSGIDANGDGIDDAVAASYADPDGDVWAGISDPSGLQLGLKNADSTISEYDYRNSPTANDLFVSNDTVNEASPWANFSISGSPGKQVFLSLKTLGVGPGFATDTSGASPSDPADYGPTIQVLVGASWVNYTDASGVILDGSGAALARVSIVNDLSGVVHEGPEVFQLEARDGSGVISSGGIGIIDDEGIGVVFLSSNITDIPDDPSGGLYNDGSGAFSLDDDRIVQIDNPRINEGSPYAVFRLTGTTETFTLLLEGALQDAQWTATEWDGSGAALDASGLKDFGPSMEYWDSLGSQWIPYTGQQLTIPLSGELLVRIPINQDVLLETDASGHGETFRLKATRVVDNRDSSGGIGTISDVGSGSIYPGTFDASGNLIVDPSGSLFDDDSPIGVSNVTVNEASKWAVFDLQGAASLAFKLSLIPGNQTGQLAPVGSKDATQGSDYGTSAQIEILNNSGGWDPYNDASGAALDSLGEGKVRVRILNDTPAVYEGPETYTLRATTIPGVISSGGLGVILDDGSGLIFDPSSGAIDNAAAKDDERSLDISGGIYNEGSKWAVFDVKGAAGQAISLDLSGNTATEWSGSGADPFDPSGLKDFGPNLQVQDASGDWSDYTPATTVLLDGSGNLKVRTRLYDDPFLESIAPNESGETFYLIATTSGGGVQSSGTATILDNGQGILLDLSGNPDLSREKDSDLPSLTVQGPSNPVSEGSPLLYTVTLDNALSSDTVISLKLRDVTTETGDYEPNLSAVGEVFYFDVTDQLVTLKTAGPDQFILPAGVSKLYVRVLSNLDEIYEGEEELSLLAGLVDFPGTDVSGSGFMTDDGTGTVYDGTVDPSGGELGIDHTMAPDNDLPTLTVTTLTPSISEGSYGFFSITLDKALETAAPLSLSLLPGPGTPEGDANDYRFSSSILQVSWFEGPDMKVTRISLDDACNGSILYPAGIQEIFVSVETVADDVFEGAESFALSAALDLGLIGPAVAQLALEEVPTLAGPPALPQLTADASANIVDDGTGVSYTGALNAAGIPQVSSSGTPDNDIPSLAMTSLIPAISEGSHGLFQIDFSTPLAYKTPLRLSLRSGTAETADYGFPPDSQLFYLDGSGNRKFLNLKPSGTIFVPRGVTRLYALVDTTQDNVYEGDETFHLEALLDLPGGAVDPSGSASAVISDDGSAPMYKLDGSGNPAFDASGNLELDPSGVTDDDRSDLIVTTRTPDVSEGGMALFEVRLGSVLADPTPMRLELTGITAEANDMAFDPRGLQVTYSDYSGNPVALSLDLSSGTFTVPAGITSFLVKVNTTPDDVFEGLESFILGASLDLLDTTDDPSGSAGARIADDGSAPVYATDLSGNLVLDPSSGAPIVDSSGAPDDDRTLSIVGGVYNEASTYLFWRVQGSAGEPLRWVDLVGDPSGAKPRGDLSGTLQYRDASGIWQRLNAANYPVLDASGELLIRKAVVNDDHAEGLETFSLTLEYPGGPRATGESSLSNDGSGLIPALDGSGSPIGFDGSGNPVPSSDAIKDDDRFLDVRGGTANVASPFTFFKVDGAPGQLVTLSLNPVTAEPGSDYINQIEYSSDAGKTWTLYSPESGLVSLNGDGGLLVRVPLVNDPPLVDDPDETFQLRASNTGGTAATGTATIVDDGNGPIYNPDGTPDPSGVPDDHSLPTRLVPTDDGQGLKVIGKAGRSLWIDLSVAMADASLQNGLDLIKVNSQGQRSRIGAIGATPDSGFLGDNRFQFEVGDELRFIQVSSDLPANSLPDLQITGTDNCALIGLDDDGGEGDADDLVLKVRTSEADPYPRSSQMARFQLGSELTYLDLSWIGSEGITLNLDVQTDCANVNTIGLVKVDTDASGNPLGTVAGVAPNAGPAFDRALRANLIDYSYSQSGSQILKAPALTLAGSQAGVYAVVLTTEDDLMYTFGSISSSDRRPHAKVLGANTFGFEDVAGRQADFDYNDTVVSFRIADPSAPRLTLSGNGEGLTVVGGRGPSDGLWLDLNAVLAEAGNQNSLDLFVRDASGVTTQVGSVGATSRGTFLGSKELFLGVGETLTFVQNTNNNAADDAPSLRINQIGDRYRVCLDDEANASGDGDFNDLVIDVDRTPLEPCEETVRLAALQTSSSAGLLDLSTIGADGLTLNLAIQTDSGNTNTLGFVKLDSIATNGQYSVDGVEVGNSAAFRRAVRENLIDFRVSAGGEGEADPAVWQLVAADAGIYAAVLLTPDQDVFTPGDTAAEDGQPHLKLFGDNSFGFEDRLAGNGGDFDYNDFVVKITQVT